MNVRCPACGAAVALAVGDTRLACAACGLATPVSRVGTMPGGQSALVTLEPDLTGTTFAGRTIVERIGAGGMGTVYRASGDRGEVAIKVLRPTLGSDRAAVLSRFAREAEALRRLEHPRVVRFLEHGEDAGVAYIVTELVRGRDLAATLVAGRLSLARIIDVFVQVCDGVAAAHAAGIVHRDLKPANILVGEDGSVKVADFGLAQLGPDAAVTTLTRTDVAMGTFHYLAPEQRKDAHGIDHRADVWALGVIFYEMLTGELPLGSFAPPSAKRPDDCDRRTDRIVRRALAPDPADRFASVAELGQAVRALTPRPARRTVAVAVAAVMLAAGTAGAIAMTSGRDERPTAVATTDDPARVAPAIDKTTARELGALVDVGAPERLAPEDAAVSIDAAPVVATPSVAGSGAPAPKPKPPKPVTKPVKVVKGGKSKTSKPPEAAFGSGASDGSAAPDRKTKRTKAPEAAFGSGASEGSGGSEGSAAPARKPDPIPAVCRTASRCCQLVAGKKADCRAYLTSDAGSCVTALDNLRSLAKNPKQVAACK